jgi:hypothetical protein
MIFSSRLYQSPKRGNKAYILLRRKSCVIKAAKPCCQLAQKVIDESVIQRNRQQKNAGKIVHATMLIIITFGSGLVCTRPKRLSFVNAMDVAYWTSMRYDGWTMCFRWGPISCPIANILPIMHSQMPDLLYPMPSVSNAA